MWLAIYSWKRQQGGILAGCPENDENRLNLTSPDVNYQMWQSMGVRYVFQNFLFVVYIYNFASHISVHVNDTHQNFAKRSVFLKTLIVSKRAGQQSPRLWWNQKVRHCFQNCWQLDPKPSHMFPTYIASRQSFQINLNMFPSATQSPTLYLPWSSHTRTV